MHSVLHNVRLQLDRAYVLLPFSLITPKVCIIYRFNRLSNLCFSIVLIILFVSLTIQRSILCERVPFDNYKLRVRCVFKNLVDFFIYAMEIIGIVTREMEKVCRIR